MLRLPAFWLLIAVSLTGCGVSTSESSSDAETSLRPAGDTATSMTPQVGTGAERSVYGNATKGPLINATVELFAIDNTGFPEGTALATTQTDGAGDWRLTIDQTDAVLVRISGGSYVDEADTNINARRIVELTQDQFLESVLQPGESTVAVTVFTQALIEKSRRETGQNNFAEVIANNRSLFVQAYGFDVLSVLPADPLAPTGTNESIAYAMSVGGVANAINALSIASNSALPEYVHILKVVDDLVDCRLDGLGVGAQQVVNPALAGYQDLSLQQQVLRFRNNNYAAYEGFEPAIINASRCDELGGLADSVSPQVTSLAENVFFEALSPEGVTLSDQQREALREQFIASDDRRGELVWTIEIPQQLAMGTTPLSASVKDAWGNRTTVDWQARVADTTPPGIESLDPVSADAQGDITVVELQRPDVSDRVSAQNQIVVTNDAPDGFPVGQTLVVWTARDEAGNTATFTQAVIVNSIAPVVMPAPSMINVDSGGIDFSQYFSDPDGTTLTYSAAGLPTGSGLMLDPSTGILDGTPTPADYAAQPIALTVSANDGQNSVSLQTTLILVAPNSPPVFSLSESSFTLDEDFDDQNITIQPVEVPPAEADQQVTYAITFASQEAQDSAPFDVLLDADTLTITLVARPDANGDATFTVIADDGQNEQSEFAQAISVSVLPLNDPPQLAGPDEPLTLIVGQPIEFNFNSRVIDVDNESLVFSAVQLPAAMSISAGGQLLGMGLPADALSNEIPLQITARDEQNESVEFVLKLRVSDPDSDGDGLSNYQEQLLGFDAQLSDTDGDGFGDSLESRVEIDASTAGVLFVGANGDDGQAGDSPSAALATLSEAGARLSLLDSNQPAIILIEASSKVPGGLVLTGNGHVVIGSVDFTSLQSERLVSVTRTPSTTINSPDSAVILVNNCQQCAVYDIRVEGGRGIQVNDSVLTVDQVHVVGSVSVDGGALFIEHSDVTASNMHLAINRAERGGAVAVNSMSQLVISDSSFMGNNAKQSGGAILVSDSVLSTRNVVFTSNAAPTGAVIDALASVVNIANTTAAYNQIKSLSDDRLFRCVDGLLVTCADDSSINLRDSVIAGNRTSGGMPADLANTHSNGQGNAVEPGRGAGTFAVELASIEPFAIGFSSRDTAVLNAGSRSSLEAALDNYFSEVGSVFTDTAAVDIGVHSYKPLRPVDGYSAAAVFTDERALFNLRAIDISLAEGEQALDGSHRVSVMALSGDPHAIAISPGIVPGDTFVGAPAISLGDGRYRIWVTNGFDAGRDLLLIRLNDDTLGVEVSPTCDQLLCRLVDLSVVATGADQTADELDTEMPAVAGNASDDDIGEVISSE